MGSPKLRRCDRCGRRCRSFQAAEQWNVTIVCGVAVGITCPDCQTPEENAEAAINEATLDYANIGGLFVGRPKGQPW